MGMSASKKYKPNVEVVPELEGLAHRMVEVFVADGKKAIEARGVFCVAISGGEAPKRFFELLGEVSEATLPWEKVHLFWVDERYVPSDSEDSNYKMAADTFLRTVGIPDENVHRIPTEYEDCKIAASRYEETIQSVFGLEEGQLPEFDLIVLGIGADAHTGSLFPNSYAAFDTASLACVVYVMDEKLNRITLTHPVLCAAVHLVVLVGDKEKAKILKEVLTSEPDEVLYPVHVLWPILNKVTWLVSGGAARLL